MADNQADNFYEDGLAKVVVEYDKCLNIGGKYVEKRVKLVKKSVFIFYLFQNGR